MQEGYGLTEASPVVSILPTAKPKYLTSGPALPGVEVKVITDKEGPYVPGTVGELVVRGDNVMKGYWKNRKKQRKYSIKTAGSVPATWYTWTLTDTFTL